MEKKLYVSGGSDTLTMNSTQKINKLKKKNNLQQNIVFL